MNESTQARGIQCAACSAKLRPNTSFHGTAYGRPRSQALGVMTHNLPRALAFLLITFASLCRSETHAFHWVTGSVGGLSERNLAMLIPVAIGNKTCDMQIDTGANGSVIWHGESNTNEPNKPLTVRLGTIEATTTAGPGVLQAIERCITGSPVGSLGNAFFERGTVAIDSVRQQLSYQPGSGLAGNKTAQRFFYATWAPADATWMPTGGHILIELQTKQFGKGYGLLDTGAAFAELGVLDELWWKRLVGRDAMTGKNTTRFTVNSWGKEVECYLAQTTADVTLDTFQLAIRNANYCPALPFRPPVRVVGIVGMYPFRSSVLTIDYPGRLWLVQESR